VQETFEAPTKQELFLSVKHHAKVYEENKGSYVSPSFVASVDKYA